MLAFLLALLAPASQEASDVHVSEAYGFRISRPSPEWIFYAESGAAEQALEKLTIFVKGTAGVPSVVVYVSDPKGVVDPAVAREVAAKKLEARGATGLERGESTVAGKPSPFVRCALELPGAGKLQVRCLERIEHGFLYTLQCVRAEGDAASDAKLDAIVASLVLEAPKPVEVSAESKAWRALAAKCASDLPWASGWREASSRAKTEDKLVLAVFQNYRPLPIPNTLRTSVLMDPDVSELLRERFVVIDLDPEDEAPFRDPKSFGLGKHAFGTDFLFVDPDGKVLAECGFHDASFVDEFARGVLAGRAKPAAPSGPAIDRARAHYRRGELELAEKALGEAETIDARRLRVAILARRRQGALALEELGLAKRIAPAELLPALAVDEARVRMRMRRFEEARDGFVRVFEKWPDDPASEEAAFWLGAFDVLSLGVERGTERWKRLVEAHPGSRWAWKAAANLDRAGSFVLGGERLDWPEPDLVAVARTPAPAPLAAKELPRAEREAVAWLVEHQREDGSWWNPMDGFSVGASLYTPACSAICAEALLAHESATGARRGVERMLAYGLDLERRGRLEPGEDLAGVYSIWNRTYVAWTIARALRAKVGEAAVLLPCLERLVDSVVASQDRRGGWPYVQLAGSSGDSGIDPSATFLTAGVVLALLDAREAGAKVPKEPLDRALDFLQRARQEDGTWRYMPDIPGTQVGGTHPEACGRGPVCALALRRGGRGDAKLLASALEIFSAHRGEFLREWGKVLCHTSPEGFGAHYLFYDYLFAARALRELERDDRERLRGPIVADVLAARLADGSFQDLPGLGRPYATAMAALALRALRESP